MKLHVGPHSLNWLCRWNLAVLAVVLVTLAAQPIFAQFNAQAEVPVLVTLRAGGDVGTGINLYDPYGSICATVSSYGGTDRAFIKMVPGRLHYMFAVSSDDYDFAVLFNAPAGYRVRIKRAGETDELRKLVGVTNDAGYQIALIPDGVTEAAASKLANISIADLLIQIGIGRWSHGKSMGLMTISNPGWVSGSPGLPAALYTPAAIDVASIFGLETSNVIWSGSVVRQISTSTGLIDITSLASPAVGFKISFYLADDVQTFSGSVYTLKSGRTPYTEYTVDKPSSSADYPSGAPTTWDVLRLTVVEQGRTTYHHVFRSTSADQWKLYQSRPPLTSGGALRVDRLVTSEQTTSGGTKTKLVKVYGADGGLSLQNQYTYSALGGVYLLTKEEVGEGVLGASLDTDYEYYTTKSGSLLGEYGNLKSITQPNGLKTSFTYYNSGPSLGQKYTESRPWSDHSSPTAATWTRTLDYWGTSGDLFDDDVKTVVEKVGTTVVKKTSMDAPTYSYPGSGVVVNNRKAYLHLSDYQTREVALSAYDITSTFITAGKPTEVKLENNFKTVATRGMVSGEWYDYTATGVSSSAGGAVNITSVGGQNVSGYYAVPGKSVLTASKRNSAGLVTEQKSYPFLSTAFSSYVMEALTYSYDSYGQLLSTTLLNGTSTAATWSGGLKATETDELGVVTTYNDFDALGRLLSVTRGAVTAPSGSGYGNYPAVTTTYVYDGLGRVKSTSAADGTYTRTTSTTYDIAGRVTQQTDGDGRTQSTAYSMTGSGTLKSEVIDETLPSGSHRITESMGDGKQRSLTGSGVVPEYYRYEVLGSGHMLVTKYIGADASDRWTSTQYDLLGKVEEKKQPGFHPASGTNQPDIVETFTYGQYGQLESSQRVGIATKMFRYDAFGAQTTSAIDIAGTGINFNGLDRITEGDWNYIVDSGVVWKEEFTKVYPKDNSSTPVVTGTKRTRLSGFSGSVIAEAREIDIYGNTTTAVTTHSTTDHTRTVTVTKPGCALDEIQYWFNGKQHKLRTVDNLTYQTKYDGLGRVTESIDPRTGSIFTTYDGASSRVYQTYYNKSGGGTVALATYAYDSAGRPTLTTDAAGNTVARGYDDRGSVVKIWGTGTYPVKYVFDATYGDKVGMITYRQSTVAFSSSSWPADTEGSRTTWAYDPFSALLREKIDASGRSTRFTYNAAGQVATREWARRVNPSDSGSLRVTATYVYQPYTGELSVVNYNDGTPSVAYAYNRMGTMAEVNQGGRLHRWVYDTQNGATSTLRLQHEQLPSDLGDRYLSYQYETSTTSTTVKGRSAGYRLGNAPGNAADLDESIGYDTAARIYSIGFTPGGISTRTFTYGYVTDSPRVASVSASIATGTWAITSGYASQRDLLTDIQTLVGATVKSEYEYRYNDLDQRSRALFRGTAFADLGKPLLYNYSYNSKQEVTGASGYLADAITDASGATLMTRQFGYTYDLIGNRTSEGRTANTEIANEASYNELNQLTQRENNLLTLSGTVSPSTAKIAARSQGAGRAENYWDLAVAPDNVSGPKMDTVTIKSSSSYSLASTTFTKYVPPALETFKYDADGNLSEDGRWFYRYDAENRLIGMDTKPLAVSFGIPAEALVFSYDYQGRRIAKKSYNTVSGVVTLQSYRKYVYAGWNVIAELDGTATRQRSFAWGMDVTGSLDKSGGVGALLQVQDGSTAYLPGYDGNGNVVALVNGTSGSVAASYEYSPFGELLRQEGAYAATMPFRFSSKWTDDETGLVNYGRRYYDPRNGRFVGRDPIEEDGGLNLHGFCGNNAVNRWDRLGMDAFMTVSGYGIDQYGNSYPIWVEGDGPTMDSLHEASLMAASSITWGSTPMYNDFGHQLENEMPVSGGSASELARILNALAPGTAAAINNVVASNEAFFGAQIANLADSMGANALAAIDSYGLNANNTFINSVSTGWTPNSAPNSGLPLNSSGTFTSGGMIYDSHGNLIGEKGMTDQTLAVASLIVVPPFIKSTLGAAFGWVGAKLGGLFGRGADAAAGREAEALADGAAVPTRCFPAGTKVSTPRGDVNIEDIKVGDTVYACDLQTGETVERNVTELLHNFTYHWVDVQVDSEVIRATRSHPFWVESTQDWVEAADLKSGMIVRLENGHSAAITSVAMVDLQQSQPTYNLEVAVNHDYFVSGLHVLVHNGDGSYTITFASGQQYVGKGDLSRMAESAARITAQTGDRVVSTQWTPANGTADSFVQEEMRMRAAGGPGGNTYNQINSPGNNIAAANGCP